MPEANTPIETFRDGNLEASVFLNQGDKGPFHSVSLSRLYTDDQGKVCRSNTFGSNDLLRVSNLSNKAYEYVLQSRQREREHAREHSQDRGADASRPRQDFGRGAQQRPNRSRSLSR